jgi:hypothetical protein
MLLRQWSFHLPPAGCCKRAAYLLVWAGKTTIAMQFLLEGTRRGEPALYVSISEKRL